MTALAAVLAGCGGGAGKRATTQPGYNVSKPPVARAVGPGNGESGAAGVAAGRGVARGPLVGISDQDPDTFADPRFKGLGIRYARLITPWDSMRTEPDRLDGWLQAARAAGVQPLVAFNHSRVDLCPAKPCRGGRDGNPDVRLPRRVHGVPPEVPVGA